MKNSDLIYDWIDFIVENKSTNRRHLFKEQTSQVLKASQTNPEAAAAFGDFEYSLSPNPKDDRVTVVGNSPPMGTARLICGTNNHQVGTVKFHQKYVNNLETALERLGVEVY